MQVTLYGLPDDLSESDLPELMSHVGAYSTANIVHEQDADGGNIVIAYLSQAHDIAIRRGEFEWRGHKIFWSVPTLFGGNQ